MISFSGSAIKEEDLEAVSPPPQAEMVPLVNEQKPIPDHPMQPLPTTASRTRGGGAVTNSPPLPPTPSRISETQRILPPSEPRKTGTCYFCKKSFMKNKQLMNHVCPKKPRGGGGGGGGGSNSGGGTLTSTIASKSPS